MDIVWKGSPNYTPGRPGWDGLYIIVLHTMEGYLNGADAWFNNPASQVSTHYGVGFNGEIHQYVNEDDIAWANGQDYANRNGISIEFEDQQNPYDATRTDALYETGAQLIADICKRRNIACNTSGIKRHNEFVDKVCPGALDVNRLINRANEIMNNTTTIQDQLRLAQEGNIQKDNAINTLVAKEKSYIQQISELTNQVNTLRSQVTSLSSQVQTLTQQLNTANSNQNSQSGNYQSTIDTLKTQVDNLTKENQTLKAGLSTSMSTNKNTSPVTSFITDFLGRFTSRKFLLTVAAVVITILNEKLGLKINTNDLVIIASVIISFITLEGVNDIKNGPNNQNQIQQELLDILNKTPLP